MGSARSRATREQVRASCQKMKPFFCKTLEHPTPPHNTKQPTPNKTKKTKPQTTNKHKTNPTPNQPHKNKPTTNHNKNTTNTNKTNNPTNTLLAFRLYLVVLGLRIRPPSVRFRFRLPNGDLGASGLMRAYHVLRPPLPPSFRVRKQSRLRPLVAGFLSPSERLPRESHLESLHARECHGSGHGSAPWLFQSHPFRVL